MSFAIESSPYHSRHMNGIVWSDLLTLNETRQTVEIMASLYIYIQKRGCKDLTTWLNKKYVRI